MGARAGPRTAGRRVASGAGRAAAGPRTTPGPQAPPGPIRALCKPDPRDRSPALTSSRRFCQRPHGDSSRISDSSSLSSSSSSSSGGAAEVTGADTEVIPGPDEADSGFESEPPLGTCLDSPSDMLRSQNLRAGGADREARGGGGETRPRQEAQRAGPGRVALRRAALAGPVSRGRALGLLAAPDRARAGPRRRVAPGAGRGGQRDGGRALTGLTQHLPVPERVTAPPTGRSRQPPCCVTRRLGRGLPPGSQSEERSVPSASANWPAGGAPGEKRANRGRPRAGRAERLGLALRPIRGGERGRGPPLIGRWAGLSSHTPAGPLGVTAAGPGVSSPTSTPRRRNDPATRRGQAPSAPSPFPTVG